MRVISKRRLREFWESPGQGAAKGPLLYWYDTTSAADWKKWADLRATFPSADQVGDCVVFNVGGNRYRIIGRVRYETRRVYVLKVMMHREYDRNQWPDECGCHDDPPGG